MASNLDAPTKLIPASASDKAYKFAIADQGVSGTFNDFKHTENDPAKVTILVDKNGDGVFNMKKEAFDAVKPFRVGASVFEVASIDPRGTKVILRRSGKAASRAAV